jgi:triacylglycerol lipase
MISRSSLRAWMALPLAAATATTSGQEHVILLHGLSRTQRSMHSMENSLRRAGYRVWNIGYPSRTASIRELSETAIGKALADCRSARATRIHFVTHSLGGILVRSYLSTHDVPELGRVVMLAPPNQGSELVDVFGHWKLFRWLHGQTGRELGTTGSSTPNRLGAVTFELGIIAGNLSIRWVNSCLIPGPDDGTVSVERTKVAGMSEHILIPATHTFIMRNRTALRHTLSFLQTGTFAHSGVKSRLSLAPTAQWSRSTTPLPH